jgi:hypothetical protein
MSKEQNRHAPSRTLGVSSALGGEYLLSSHWVAVLAVIVTLALLQAAVAIAYSPAALVSRVKPNESVRSSAPKKGLRK